MEVGERNVEVEVIIQFPFGYCIEGLTISIKSLSSDTSATKAFNEEKEVRMDGLRIKI